jgi:four helix bundle protein
MGFFFEDLDVYKKSQSLNEKIDMLIEEMPNGNFAFFDHLKKASLSISANIAESSGRFHKADKINFLYVSRGAAYECIPILDLLKRKGLIKDTLLEELRDDIESISKMLSGWIRSLKNSEIRKPEEKVLD